MSEHIRCENHGTCIEFNDVGFSYNGVPVLEHTTFTVHCGEYVGIVGPNGGGKTTVIRLALGLLEPTSGTVRVLGENPLNLRERYKIGYVPQGISHANVQFPATVEEIVRSGRTPRKKIFQRFTALDGSIINNAIEKTGIQKLRDKLIGDLSGGERQKVFIARALAAEPDVLILDEPTVGVDNESRDRFYTLLSGLHKDLGLTVIFVTHDTDVIAREAQSILCVNRSILCHEPSSQWRNREHTEHLYGHEVAHIHHQH